MSCASSAMSVHHDQCTMNSLLGLVVCALAKHAENLAQYRDLAEYVKLLDCLLQVWLAVRVVRF